MKAYLPSLYGNQQNPADTQECETCNGTGEVLARRATCNYPAEGTECPDCNGEGVYQTYD